MNLEERRQIKREIRKKVMEACARSRGGNCYGYSTRVKNPKPWPHPDRRREARASGDLDTQQVVITIFDNRIEMEKQVYLNLIVDTGKLAYLSKLAWHPTVPCSPLIRLAQMAVDE